MIATNAKKKISFELNEQQYEMVKTTADFYGQKMGPYCKLLVLDMIQQKQMISSLNKVSKNMETNDEED